MMDEDFKKVVTFGIISVLLVLTFFVLQPILLSIIMGIILAIVFIPVYDYTLKYVKNRSFNAAIICSALILLILLMVVLVTPLIIQQSFQVYVKAQQIDFKNIIEAVFPSFFSTEGFSTEIGSVLNTFVTKSINSFVNLFSQLILNLPSFLLQMLIVFATFFFVLRDREGLMEYVRSLMPFSKDIENKMFKSSKDITLSVIYGQVVVGALQGVIVSVGFFIFGVPNAIFLTFLAILAGIFPIIGTTLVWVPVMVFLIIAGNTLPGFGIALFGVIGSAVDNIVRPILVSKRTSMHPLLILIGMIGGLFLFGILGFILGPLIIAYVLIILEIYRGKAIKGVFVTNTKT